VEIFHGLERVAFHRRATEPFARVIDPQHFAGLWRGGAAPVPLPALGDLGRNLADYAAVVAGGDQ